MTCVALPPAARLAFEPGASGFADYDDSWGGGFDFGGMQPLGSWIACLQLSLCADLGRALQHAATCCALMALGVRKYLIIGGLAILCWKGIIPIHRMESRSALASRMSQVLVLVNLMVVCVLRLLVAVAVVAVAAVVVVMWWYCKAAHSIPEPIPPSCS